MLTETKLGPAIIRPNEARVVHAFGDVFQFQLTGETTNGQLTAFIGTTPPNSGPPPHLHKNEDEWFCPLEGDVEFFVDGVWHSVPLNSAVFVPRNTVHTFRNVGDTPLKMLTYFSPSGIENYFMACAKVFAVDGPPDMAQIMAISAEYGVVFVTN